MTESELVLKGLFGAADDGAFSGPVVNEKSARVTYWKKPDGSIGIGPEVGTDAPKYQQYISKGWKQLPPRFGFEVMNKGDMTPLKQVRGREHWWLKPFMDAGGLTYICELHDSFGKEGEYLIPAEQLVTLNFHRVPGMREQRPDLAGATDLPCPYGCIDEQTRRPRLFAGLTRDQAQRSVDQHIVAMHKDAVASRAVGDTISKAMESVLGKGGGGMTPETIAAIVAATVTAMTGTQKAAVAQVAVEAEPIDEPVEIAPIPSSTYPDDSWTRQSIIAWASGSGMLMPPNPLALTKASWLQWVDDHAPSAIRPALTSSDAA